MEKSNSAAAGDGSAAGKSSSDAVDDDDEEAAVADFVETLAAGVFAELVRLAQVVLVSALYSLGRWSLCCLSDLQ